MVAAHALIAIVSALAAVALLWSAAGPWSLLAAPFVGSLVVVVVATVAPLVRNRVADEGADDGALTTDEMVAALRSVLPDGREPQSGESGRRAA